MSNTIRSVKALLIAPKFPYSFWSLPESCGLAGVKTPSPPLGLITVAGLLPAHWDLRLVDMNVLDPTPEDWEWADVIFFSGMVIQIDPLRQLLAKAKELGKPTVVGGPVTSSYPNKVVEAGGTYTVVGEAEAIIHEVIAAVENKAPACVIRAENRPDLAKSIIPRFDLLDLSAYDSITVQTSRGCPHNCEFCDVIKINGRRQRFKTPQQVIAELDALYELGWRGSVFIADDNFIGHKPHARALLAELILWQKRTGGGFGFLTQVTASLGDDLELIDLMTAANFSQVFVGVETPNEDVLRKANKHQNIQTPLTKSLSVIMKNGLSVIGSFIVGLDGETAGSDKRLCEFVEAINIPLVMINLIAVPPNTDLWKRMEREGRLLPDARSDGMLHTNCLTTRPIAEIKAEYVAAWKRLYDPASYLKRVYRHCLEMRPTRKAMQKQGASVDVEGIVPDPKKSNTPTSTKLSVLARLCWRQGVIRSSRWRFWPQLIGILRKNPSRFIKYMTLCTLGEDMFEFCNYLEKHASMAPPTPRKAGAPLLAAELRPRPSV